MKNIFLFSDDKKTIATFSLLFNAKELEIKRKDEFPKSTALASLVIIDGDYLTPEEIRKKTSWLQRKKIPIVYIVQTLPEKKAMRLLKHKVVSILFKDDAPHLIKQEIHKIIIHKNYIEHINDVARNERKIKTLLNIMKNVTSDKNIDDIMAQILMTTKDAFNLQSISLFLQTETKIKAKMIFGEGLHFDSQLQWNMSELPLWMHKLMNQRKPQLINKISQQDYPFPIHSVLLPLIIKDNFYGFLCAVFHFPFENLKSIKKDIALLNAFTEQACVAIENAHLYLDVIKAREEVVAKEKNALLGQMIISLNHEINNPLSIISLEAQILQKTIQHKESNVDLRLAKIESNIDRIKGILEKISSLTVEDYTAVEYFTGKEMANLQ